MKLTTKESTTICKYLSLGNFKSIKLIKGGLVNHNFILKTNKGEFIIRILGQKITTNKKRRLNDEFELMEFLEKKKFPYSTPLPIKNSNGKRLHKINNKNFWIYKKLLGKSKSTMPNLEQSKEIAKALSTYHKFLKGFKVRKNGYQEYLKWVLKIINKINLKSPKNKIDKLALKEKNFFKEIVLGEIKRNYSKNLMVLHGDFDASNVLFKKNKVLAIIDFDDLSYVPRILDIAVALRDACTVKNKLDENKTKIFLKEYEKINRLSKEEKRLIPNIILAENASFFAWAYSEMKKEKENRYKYMKEMSELSHNLIKK